MLNRVVSPALTRPGAPAISQELRMKGLLRDELLLPRIGASLPTLLTSRILVSPMTARSSVSGCLVRTFVHRPCFLVALATCAVATVGVAHTSAWTSGQQDSPGATHRPLPPNRANPATSPYPQNIPTTPEDVSRLRQAAERGDARAQFALGFMYFSGIGVTRNPVDA